MKRKRLGWAAISIVTALTACGGGGSSTVSSQTYSLSATISGLNSSGLVLLVNGTAVSVAAGATTQALASSLSSGISYSVTVQTQPTGLTCSVSNGSGTVGAADVTSVSITCVSNTTILYSFAGSPHDGAGPWAGLTLGSDGNFYGTTSGGGTNNDGTVFKITPSGTETVLYSFAGGSSDGASPGAGLIQDSDGNFYGTTQAGGASDGGTVFEITPTGTETVLYSFAVCGGCFISNYNPEAGLIQGSDGNFYGTTEIGGASGNGTVFKITPSGTETVLYSFAGGSSDGGNPQAGLTLGSDGNFYGTTQKGGINNDGTVFKITPSGTETVLYSFAGGSSDGAYAFAGLIQGSDGNFYGTTQQGGTSDAGAVFKITPSGTETVLYFFAGGDSDGGNPDARLIQGSDGNFYGTTSGGGTYHAGAVFKITPSGTETVLYFFAGGSDGAYPYAGLIQGSDGNFYGTTQAGGPSGNGTVFKLTPQ